MYIYVVYLLLNSKLDHLHKHITSLYLLLKKREKEKNNIIHEHRHDFHQAFK